jgi:tetratricopeptide (TPR) repeat protein
MDKKIAVISIILIAVLGFLIYAPSLNGKFIYDDKFLVKDNSYVKSWTNLPKVFTQDIGSGADQPYSFYRPLQMISYMADYSIWGLKTLGYHLTNVILHVLAAIAVYWFVSVLFSHPLLSLITGLLFVAHPMHTEAICYISGRSDPLSLIFFLFTFIFYIKQTRKDDAVQFGFMIASYILAILARENCMIMPLLFLLYHYTLKEKMKPKLFLPILGMSVLYIILRVTALKFLIQNLPIHTTVLERLPGFFVAMTGYARILFWPFDLHVEYGAPVFPWNNPAAITGIFIFIAILALLVIKRRSSLTFFSIAWFLITLFPVANIYPINAYMAEHWLYLPCIGLFMLMAKAITWLGEKKKLYLAAAVITATLISFYSFITLKQNEYWNNPVSFYERTVKYINWNPKLYDNLGDALCSAGRDADAVPYFKRAIELDPMYTGAHNNLGNVYFKMGKYDDAFALYRKSVEIKPNFALGYLNLGNVAVVMGRTDEALAYYARSAELAPNNAGVYSNMGLVHKISGNRNEAAKFFNKAIEVNPDFALAYSLLAQLYLESGDRALAAKYYQKGVSLGQPRNPEFEKLLGGMSR